MKKWGIAVLFAASLGAATNAHAFFNFGCGNNEWEMVQIQDHTVLTGSNLVRRIFDIVGPCDRRKGR